MQALTDMALSLPFTCRALTVTRYWVPGSRPFRMVEFRLPSRVTVWTGPLGMAPYSTVYRCT